MKYLPFVFFVSFAVCCTSAAWGQNALYGSPELLRVPSQNAVQETQPQIPASYASAGAAASQPAPVTVYPQAQAPTPQPAPAQAYPQAQGPAAQPVSAAAYQQAPAQNYQPAPVQPQEYNPQPQPNYYPAQTPATAMYQPYQSGAKNRYPAPALRPATAGYADPSSQIPPMPAPPGTLAASPRNAPAASMMSGEAQPLQSTSVMNQMLVEQGGCGDNGCAPNGTCGGAMGRGYGRSGACGESVSLDGCGPGSYCPWYTSISALVMGRSEGRRVWTSYEDGNLSNQLTNTQFGLQWNWGGEVRMGRRFCHECVPYALEASFWTTEQFSGTKNTSLLPGGYVSTPLTVRYLDFNGTLGTAWFDGAREHNLARQDEFQNLEINILREQLALCNDSCWDVGWIAGIRYFRFREMLTFSAISHDGTGDAYLQDNITNNLIGAQVGFDAAYNLKNGLRLFVTPKFGVYDNILDSTFQAKARLNSNSPYVDGTSSEGTFPATGSKVGLSFLTQIDLGADWQFSKNWSARAGYRVVALTGMGLADDQFPQYINDIPEIQNVSHSSSLILHGAFFGLMCNY
jgi:hypothetical protein